MNQRSKYGRRESEQESNRQDFGNDSEFEEFYPDDLLSVSRPKSRQISRKRIILAVVLGTLGVAFCVLFLWLYRLSSNPASLFEQQDPVTLELSPATESPASAPALEVTPEPSPSPTLDPYSALQQQADKSIMQNIVNIMLIGIDYADERLTWSGKDGLSAAHADTMIVLAVNFDNNTADLISLPRDTYAKIPGVDGIYKLNASLNCGGGMIAANGAGFKKVCESASRMIGGLPINYYYAVTMPAVKTLVDAIGGVDYDLDVSFKIQGRSYKKGLQHMDGQAVLDYLRVRKSGSGLSSGETGDVNRIDRQKRMLVTIFSKVKSANLLTSIPQLLDSMSSEGANQFYTNCTTGQTAALALYAYSMPAENISMHSMSGPIVNLYSWNFCFPKPATRRQIIESVYGISAPDLLDCTQEYAEYLYRATVAEQYLETCESLTRFLERNVDPDALISADTPSEPEQDPVVPVYDDPVPTEAPPKDTPKPPSPTEMPEATPEPPAPTEAPEATPEPPAPTEEPEPETTPEPVPPENEEDNSENADQMSVVVPEGIGKISAVRLSMFRANARLAASEDRGSGLYSVYSEYMDAYEALSELVDNAHKHASKYLNGNAKSMSDYASSLAEACGLLQSCAEEAADAFSYSGNLDWEIPPVADTNEIYVDFR